MLVLRLRLVADDEGRRTSEDDRTWARAAGVEEGEGGVMDARRLAGERSTR